MELDHGQVGQREVHGLDFIEQQESTKSSLRMLYAAEIKVFKAQHGGLENIREKLGFSRRKMCQLLMVDPSAWTRWCKDESRVPPHVYRALEWYLALAEKALTQPDLAAVFTARYSKAVDRGDAPRIQELEHQVSALKLGLRRQHQVTWLLLGTLLALCASGLVLLI